MTKYRSFAARLACLKSYSCLQEDIEYVQIVVLSEPHILGWSDFAFIRDKIHNEESRWMEIPTYCCLSLFAKSQNFFSRTMPNVSTFPSLLSSELTIVAWDPQPKSSRLEFNNSVLRKNRKTFVTIVLVLYSATELLANPLVTYRCRVW